MAELETKISNATVKAEDKEDEEEFEDAEEGEAPTLVEAKPEDESASSTKLKQELEDESPKTFPQVVRYIVKAWWCPTLPLDWYGWRAVSEWLLASKSSANTPFSLQLMDILNDEEDQDTIAWLPHGRSFIIYKKKKFACKLLLDEFFLALTLATDGPQELPSQSEND